MKNYKLRNIIVLGIFNFLIIVAGGYLVFYSYPNKINKIEASIKETEKKIAALEGIEEELIAAKKMLEEQKKKLAKVDKQLTSEVFPAQTYDYLNSILNYSGVLKFDLIFMGREEKEGYGYENYRLKGEGFYPTLYKFLWYIERGPQIFQIKRINFRGVENREIDSTRTKLIIPFEMEFRAVYTGLQDVPKIERSLRSVRTRRVSNPYLPYIYRNLPLNSDGLLEVERATLKGILPGKAFVEDHAGKVHVLQSGDKVYLGYVSKIDSDDKEIEFILNKGGIIQYIKLKLGFQNLK